MAWHGMTGWMGGNGTRDGMVGWDDGWVGWRLVGWEEGASLGIGQGVVGLGRRLAAYTTHGSGLLSDVVGGWPWFMGFVGRLVIIMSMAGHTQAQNGPSDETKRSSRLVFGTSPLVLISTPLSFNKAGWDASSEVSGTRDRDENNKKKVNRATSLLAAVSFPAVVRCGRPLSDAPFPVRCSPSASRRSAARSRGRLVAAAAPPPGRQAGPLEPLD